MSGLHSYYNYLQCYCLPSVHFFISGHRINPKHPKKMNSVVTGYTYEYDKRFGGDRLAKNDLTASTLHFLFKNDKNVTFWEKDDNGVLVPYGDPKASKTDKYDLYVKYFNMWFAIEMKSRNLPHNSKWVTATTEGEIFEIAKCNETKQLQQQGYICLWASVYNDGKIRIWQLNYMDLNSLPLKPKTKHRYTIYDNSEIITEMEYLLPPECSIIIDRLNGN